MADNEEGKENAPRANEWEVVSLTSSAYAAAPGPQPVDSSHDIQPDLENEAETSGAMFMSRHFIFPPNQHENLPLEPDYSEVHGEKGGESDFSHLVAEEGDKIGMKDEEDVSVNPLISNDFPGIQGFDGKGNRLSVGGADFESDLVFETEKSIYSLHEATIEKPNTLEEDMGTDEALAHQVQDSDSELLNFQKPVEGDEYDGGDLPCEAWWKRQALSIYVHAKEANTFWSIFIAAAVMGLVIIGHTWQQERWQVLHLKWRFGVSDERMGRLLGPISRLKDAIVGGHRRGSLVRGSTSTER